MNDNFHTKGLIGIVHPTMKRAIEMQKVYGKEYDLARSAYFRHFNVPETSTQVCIENCTKIVEYRLKDLAKDNNASPKIVEMYMWLRANLNKVGKYTLVDFMIYDVAKDELKGPIERFLSMKYGPFLETLASTSAHAYRL